MFGLVHISHDMGLDSDHSLDNHFFDAVEDRIEIDTHLGILLSQLFETPFRSIGLFITCIIKVLVLIWHVVLCFFVH